MAMGIYQYIHYDINKMYERVKERHDGKLISSGITPLHMACQYGNVEVVRELLSVPGIEVNKVNATGKTPLFIACQNGHVELTRLLLNDTRVVVNIPTTDGWTPLSVARKNRHVEIVSELEKKLRQSEASIQEEWPGFQAKRKKRH